MFEGRRKTIYEEIDRAGGSSWAQISSLCLQIISDVDKRISLHQYPEPQTEQEDAATKARLPRLASGLREENIFESPQAKSRKINLAHAAAEIAKVHGQSPSSPASKAKKLLEKARENVLSPDSQSNTLANQAGQYLMQALSSPLGAPFRHPFRRQINLIILGSPYGDVGVIKDAIKVLTRLAICSLKEDPYGHVQRDIPDIIRSFANTIINIENMLASHELHWSDIEKSRCSPEAESLLDTLKTSLQELIDVFGVFSETLKLSPDDIKRAETAAAPKRTASVTEAKPVEPRSREARPEEMAERSDRSFRPRPRRTRV
jgi:nucleoporin NDC1